MPKYALRTGINGQKNRPDEKGAILEFLYNVLSHLHCIRLGQFDTSRPRLFILHLDFFYSINLIIRSKTLYSKSLGFLTISRGSQATWGQRRKISKVDYIDCFLQPLCQLSYSIIKEFKPHLGCRLLFLSREHVIDSRTENCICCIQFFIDGDCVRIGPLSVTARRPRPPPRPSPSTRKPSS